MDEPVGIAVHGSSPTHTAGSGWWAYRDGGGERGRLNRREAAQEEAAGGPEHLVGAVGFSSRRIPTGIFDVLPCVAH